MKVNINNNIKIEETKNFKLGNLSTNYSNNEWSEKEIKAALLEITEQISEEQEKLFASDNHSILIVLQAIDAAGKDSCIKHVFTGVNPQGVHVVSFKQPSKEELDHDFLWRVNKNLPERGMINVFNRSHYEEVIVTKVHPEYILGQNIPNINDLNDINKEFWQKRYQSINEFEKHLTENGTVIIKFFLNLSKDEQKNRFLDRINTPKKNWKFSATDLKERKLWNDYQLAYQEMIENTSTKIAPWYVIPSDNQWESRLLAGQIILEHLQQLDLKYPVLNPEELKVLELSKQELMEE